MSRQGTAPAARQLTLTEELEKLEQSITLTLQEIDHNFSRAHRIVTSSILPVVEQYAEHSRHVWEGSKFWKQFFEASANVSLSGYEEPPEEEGDEEEETTVTLDTSATDEGTPSSYSSAPHEEASDFQTPRKKASGAADDDADADADPSALSSPDYSTPRPDRGTATAVGVAAAGKYASPYETLRREVQGGRTEDPPSSSTFPSTPRAQTYGHHDAVTPQTGTTAKKHRTPGGGANNDVLLHRVLDRNYRIQATPHAPAAAAAMVTGGGASSHAKKKGGRSGAPTTPGTATASTHPKGTARLDELDSSPLEEAPRFSSDLFRLSPGKRDGRSAMPAPVPGVSVLATPGRKGQSEGGGGHSNKPTTSYGRSDAHHGRDLDFDDDEDDDFAGLPEGMSPPKTMQFYIPQSKLLKTPAKEASRQIVEDLLLTAGGPLSDDETDELVSVQMAGEDSPSVVGKGAATMDESF